MRYGILPCFLSLALGIACSPPVTPTDSGPDGDEGIVGEDQDDDCISDIEEEYASGRDTDGDGTPDFRDTDSDDDGLSDREEAMNPDCESGQLPADSDEDGIPNYIDVDSDENGIPDREDGVDDTDNDGIPDYADRDDDNDLITDAEELGVDPADPPDSDGDAIPDYHDTDSDNDTIPDTQERGADVDDDGLPDYIDVDSDNDGMLDSLEAGDANPETFPVDSDDDGTPDFRDSDSDNDGLSDAWEWEHRDTVGTSPTDQDTDGDGVIDWIEVAAGTDPTNGTDSPRTRGHFVFVIPYEEDPDPPNGTLAFSTSLQMGDVFFSLDVTGSMSTELESIRTKLTDIIEGVTCPCEDGPPDSCDCIPDLWVGFSWHTDVGDGHALTVERNLTDDYESVIASMPAETGGGSEECQRKAAYCTVHGVGDPYCPSSAVQNNDEYPCAGAGIGFPCFRPDAARMLVAITDENMDQDPIPDYDTVAEELLSAQITYIGVNAEETRDPEVTLDLTEIAVRTGSFDEYGAPLVFMGADAAVADTVADAIRTVARVPLDVTARPLATVQEGVNPIDFIEYLQANLTGEAPCTAWDAVRDEDGDGRDDTFIQITPGTPVCWDISIRPNTIAPPTEEPQVFVATIEVRGGAGGTLLDSRDVYFLVPPETYIAPPD
jgi:hypothetical protein